MDEKLFFVLFFHKNVKFSYLALQIGSYIKERKRQKKNKKDFDEEGVFAYLHGRRHFGDVNFHFWNLDSVVINNALWYDFVHFHHHHYHHPLSLAANLGMSVSGRMGPLVTRRALVIGLGPFLEWDERWNSQ